MFVLTDVRLRLHDDGLNTRRKSGGASSHFILRLDKHFREEIGERLTFLT
jgi:hypothetical protein